MAVVLKAGRVMDPASGRDEIADVVVQNGVIAAVGPDLAAEYPGAEIIDCTGQLVTPGLIDLHVHVYPGLGDFCVHPDRAGVDVGVPVVHSRALTGRPYVGISIAPAFGRGRQRDGRGALGGL